MSLFFNKIVLKYFGVEADGLSAIFKFCLIPYIILLVFICAFSPLTARKTRTNTCTKRLSLGCIQGSCVVIISLSAIGFTLLAIIAVGIAKKSTDGCEQIYKVLHKEGETLFRSHGMTSTFDACAKKGASFSLLDLNFTKGQPELLNQTFTAI